MQASKQSISSIFNGNRILEVPFYQRRYVWEEEQWKRFLQDMEFISSSEKDYFLGSIILKQRNTNIGSADYRMIIDGQQRLTTFIVFAKSLCLKTNDNNTFDKKFTVRIDGQNGVALHHSHNDRFNFEKIHSLQEDIPLEGDNNNLFRCYNYFQKHINEYKLNIDVILTHAIFIDIDLQPNDEEQTIFNTINSLGMRLTTAELLKNYFFNENSISDFRNLWKPVFEKDEETIRYWDSQVTMGRIKRSNIEIFFSAFLNIKIQDRTLAVNADDKAFFRRTNNLYGNYKDFIDKYQIDKRSFVQEIIAYAQLYRDNFKVDIASSLLPGKCGIERINFIINVLDSSTLVPYFLYVLKNQSNKEEIVKMFGYLESYIMRRQICKCPNNSYSDLFNQNLIGNTILTFDRLKEYIERKDEVSALAFPSDENVSRCLEEEEQPNKRALVILYMIETRLRYATPYATMLYPFDEYTLEHLMPKKYTKHWPLNPGFDEEDRRHLIMTLGNMAMIPHRLNSSISNGDWDTKKTGSTRDKGLNYLASDIEILRDVLSCERWDETQILKHSKHLSRIVMKIWPFDGDIDYNNETPSYIVSENADGIQIKEPESKLRKKHDYTQYSLNHGSFESKSDFVLSLVKAFVRKYPRATFSQIKEVFNNSLCAEKFKCIGFICTEKEYNLWTSSTKERRYKPTRPNGSLKSADGITFYVSTQWTKEAMGPIVELAKREGFVVDEKER